MNKTITRKLMDLGVKCNLKGFDCLERAISLVLEDNDYIHAITKRLYPEIAKGFKTTPSRTERVIRHAIKSLANEEYAKMTNAEFIAFVAKSIQIENLKEENEHIRQTHISHETYEIMVEDLEKENAELKRLLEMERCQE